MLHYFIYKFTVNILKASLNVSLDPYLDLLSKHMAEQDFLEILGL